jgi:hypothetical protein
VSESFPPRKALGLRDSSIREKAECHTREAPLKHQEISTLFEKIADLMEFKGENPFKASAYRRTAGIWSEATLGFSAAKLI